MDSILNHLRRFILTGVAECENTLINKIVFDNDGSEFYWEASEDVKMEAGPRGGITKDDILRRLLKYIAFNGWTDRCVAPPDIDPKCSRCSAERGISGEVPLFGGHFPLVTLRLSKNDTVHDSFMRKFEICCAATRRYCCKNRLTPHRTMDDPRCKFLFVNLTRTSEEFDAGEISEMVYTNRGSMFRLRGGLTPKGCFKMIKYRGLVDSDRKLIYGKGDCRDDEPMELLCYERIPAITLKDLPGTFWLTAGQTCVNEEEDPFAIIRSRNRRNHFYYMFISEPKSQNTLCKVTSFEMLPAMANAAAKGVMGTRCPPLMNSLGVLHSKHLGGMSFGDSVATELYSQWCSLLKQCAGDPKGDRRPDRIFGTFSRVSSKCSKCFKVTVFDHYFRPHDEIQVSGVLDRGLVDWVDRSFVERRFVMGVPRGVPRGVPDAAFGFLKLPEGFTAEMDVKAFHRGERNFKIYREGGLCEMSRWEWREVLGIIQDHYSVEFSDYDVPPMIRPWPYSGGCLC